MADRRARPRSARKTPTRRYADTQSDWALASAAEPGYAGFDAESARRAVTLVFGCL
jgi:hypothetical protein